MFEDEIYRQTDGVPMGSALSPILASIFMGELETTIVPALRNFLCKWKRYIDDIYSTVKTDNVNEILLDLNSFHINIKFTYDTESNNLPPFLDVLVTRKSSSIETNFYSKPTNNEIHLNWNSY